MGSERGRNRDDGAGGRKKETTDKGGQGEDWIWWCNDAPRPEICTWSQLTERIKSRTGEQLQR